MENSDTHKVVPATGGTSRIGQSAAHAKLQTRNKMNKNITISLFALALLLTGLFVSACSSNTAQESVHFMGSAPMGDAKMPGFHLKPAADGDRDNFGHGYVSGSGDPT
jgi:hypothetical protein